MRSYLWLFIVCFFIASCQSAKNHNSNDVNLQKKDVLSPCAATGVFNKEDSSGIFQGPLVGFLDTTLSVGSGEVFIKDKAGDSIDFSFHYGEAKNIDAKKLLLGSCVKITYHRKIYLEDGVEVNRKYYIDDVEYIHSN
jgi:hypothetical protein